MHIILMYIDDYCINKGYFDADAFNKFIPTKIQKFVMQSWVWESINNAGYRWVQKSINDGGYRRVTEHFIDAI